MKTDGSELEDVGWVAAEAALAAAQQMPGGRERIAALKEDGLLRFEADERRRAIRDQEHASKLDLARQIKAQRLLAREPENRGGRRRLVAWRTRQSALQYRRVNNLWPHGRQRQLPKAFLPKGPVAMNDPSLSGRSINGQSQDCDSRLLSCRWLHSGSRFPYIIQDADHR
jgi:hypothetical protein